MDETGAGLERLAEEKRRHYEDARRVLDEMAALVQEHLPVPAELEARLQASLQALRDANRRLEGERRRKA